MTPTLIRSFYVEVNSFIQSPTIHQYICHFNSTEPHKTYSPYKRIREWIWLISLTLINTNCNLMDLILYIAIFCTAYGTLSNYLNHTIQHIAIYAIIYQKICPRQYFCISTLAFFLICLSIRKHVRVTHNNRADTRELPYNYDNSIWPCYVVPDNTYIFHTNSHSKN